MTATYLTDLQSAIDRSISHNEIASVRLEARDISEVLAELGSLYDGEIDSARENDGSYDVWGYPEGTENETDWRLNVQLPTVKIGEWGYHKGMGHWYAYPADADAVRDAYDRMDSDDLGPDCDADIIAAGGVFVVD